MKGKYTTSKAEEGGGLPRHPFVVAGFRTFRKTPVRAQPMSRADELAQIARAKITVLPKFEGKVIGLGETAPLDRDFE